MSDEKRAKNKRAGQTQYVMWVPDGDIARWRTFAREKGYKTLARFVKELVNGVIRDSQSSLSKQEITSLKEELAQLRGQQQETRRAIDTKFEELKEAVLHSREGVENNVLPEIKSRILGVMEIAGKPVSWKALLQAVGAPKKTVGDALEDLLKKGILAMTKHGDWALAAGEGSREE